MNHDALYPRLPVQRWQVDRDAGERIYQRRLAKRGVYGVSRVIGVQECRALLALSPAQLAVYKIISKMRGTCMVQFPDGRPLEIDFELWKANVREPGQQEWERTHLRGFWDWINWITDADLRLVQP